MSRKITLLLTILLVMSLSLAAGCFRQYPLVNSTGIIVSSSTGDHLSAAKVKQVILFSAAKRGWVARAVSPGLITATLTDRSHIAVVDIPYTGASFSIIYKSSINLDYDARDNTIHGQYISWVRNLSNDISIRLARI